MFSFLKNSRVLREIQKSIELHENGEEEASAIILRKLSEQGVAIAQYLLAKQYQRGEGVPLNKQEAIKWLHTAADQGHADSQAELGFIYADGEIVPQDIVQAYMWFFLAIENMVDEEQKTHLERVFIDFSQNVYTEEIAKAQSEISKKFFSGVGVPRNHHKGKEYLIKALGNGDMSAIRFLGDAFYAGDNVEQDYNKAIEHYTTAVNHGDMKSLTRLGQMYKEGHGFSQDDNEALKCFHKAAEQGEALAQFYMGIEYLAGKVVPKDFYEAVEWFRKSAKQGNTSGALSLARMYVRGLGGLPQNNVKAYMWFYIGIINGAEEPIKEFELLKTIMSDSDMMGAAGLAHICIANNYTDYGKE